MSDEEARDGAEAPSASDPQEPREDRREDGERVLREATFDTRYVTYAVVATTLVLALTCGGLVVLPFYLPIAAWLHRKQLARLRLVLTERSLKVERGVLNRVEKTIPLDKITDLALFQGPVMRYYELEGLRVETAGQSSSTGSALVNLIGVVEARAFREAVLAQRDALAPGGPSGFPGSLGVRAGADAGAEGAADPAAAPLLREIRDALLRIERRLDER